MRVSKTYVHMHESYCNYFFRAFTNSLFTHPLIVYTIIGFVRKLRLTMYQSTSNCEKKKWKKIRLLMLWPHLYRIFPITSSTISSPWPHLASSSWPWTPPSPPWQHKRGTTPAWFERGACTGQRGGAFLSSPLTPRALCSPRRLNKVATLHPWGAAWRPHKRRGKKSNKRFRERSGEAVNTPKSLLHSAARDRMGEDDATIPL